MTRFGLSRQPSAYAALAAAVLVAANTLGWHPPPGLEAAINGLIVAFFGAVTWTQVRPAAHSMSNDEAARRLEAAAAAARAEAAAKRRPAKRPAKKAR